jgi:hypothetical protein
MSLPYDDRIRRGQAAERLLIDEMFATAALAVAMTIKDEMFRTDPADSERREQLYAEYKGFQRVQERLAGWRADGQMAAAEVEKGAKA